MKGISLILFMLFNLTQVYSQTYEYLGLIKLPDSSVMTYKLGFEEKDGDIKGYSFTDMNGEHETKSTIIGSYDEKENVLKFRETEMIYTKSDIATTDFCDIFFTGKMRRLNGKAKIDGTFKSYYSDLSSCLNGELVMNAAEKIENRTQKFQKKVNRMRRIPDSLKQKVKMDKMFNRYAKNSLKGGEQLNIIWKDDYLKLIIWDDGEIDGDQIDLTINGNKILSAYSPVSKKKEIELIIKDAVNTISLKAINLGNKPPNTAKIQLMNKSGEIIDLASNLQVGEEITFVFYKEKPKVNQQ